ncbi:MAG: PEP-CTERM sorting domain-containing protein [Acidobacteriota bacterium]|jgi:hypothetical protein
MKRGLLYVVAILLALPSLSFSSIIGSTNYLDFSSDTVDWCQSGFGCAGAQIATPQAWTSSGGNTGLVGLVDTGQGFYNLKQGTSWGGNFSNNMGLIYNGASFGNTPTDIAITFDQAMYGAGAWIQANYFGDFTAKVTAYDVNYLSLGSYSTSGTSNGNPGTALFIGVLDSSADIWALQFDAVGIGPYEPDFAIGTMRLNSAVPEPSTCILLSLGLGAFGLVWRRKK